MGEDNIKIMYCNLEDIKGSLPEDVIVDLTDDRNPPVAVNMDNLNTAISSADGTINAYLRGKFEVPLSPVPALIKNISVDIAIFNIYTRSPGIDVPDVKITRYKDAISRLKEIKQGVMVLDMEEQSGIASETGEYRTNKTAGDKLFNKDFLSRF